MSVGCRSSRGFILVVVMFMSVLILSAATSLAWFARLEMRRVSDEEFAMVSRSLVDVVRVKVSGWIAGDNNEYDSGLEPLYSGEFPLSLSFNDWDVTIKVTPLDGQFPINGIFLPDGMTLRGELEYPWNRIWTRLNAVLLSAVVLDFLDKDSLPRPGSREEDFFLNRKISDMSELLNLPEITPGLLYKDVSKETAIDEFFTIYTDDKINVNLATEQVLSVLDSDIDAGVINSLLAFRATESIKNSKDLIRIPGFPASATARLNNVIGYKSSYFAIDMKVEHANSERNFKIFLKRTGNTCQIINWRE
ncbi:MAG: general secretion pathway protein GspK [Synergistaceae bacterium]|jgi:type II secretory pathway component PulK|nr:general secretion pathway protein GspK [Synergistaceae bacterium]